VPGWAPQCCIPSTLSWGSFGSSGALVRAERAWKGLDSTPTLTHALTNTLTDQGWSGGSGPGLFPVDVGVA